MRICVVEAYPYESLTNGDTVYVTNFCEYLCQRGHEVYFVVTSTSRGRSKPFYVSHSDFSKCKSYIARHTIKCRSFFVGVGIDHYLNLFLRLFKVKRKAANPGRQEIDWLRKIFSEVQPELSFLMFGATFFASHFEGLNAVLCPSFIPHRNQCLASVHYQNLDYDEKKAVAFVNELRGSKAVCFNSFDDITFAVDSGLDNVFYVGMGFKNRANQQSTCSDNNIILAASNDSQNIKSVLWFLDNVWPLVLTQFTNARFFLVGAICKSFLHSNFPSLELKGYVSSKELAKIYLCSKIAIAPILIGSRGVKTKVIEAISFGCPVVTTSIGIDSGRPDQFEGAALIGDTAEDFLNQILKLLSDESFLMNARKQCRIAFANSISFEASYGELSHKFAL